MSAPVCRLGNQTTIIMGQSPPGDSYNKEHAGVPLLNGPTEFGPIHPTEKQWTTAPTKLCEPGDALFCVRGATAGRLNVADKTYCLGRGLAAIRGKPGKFDAGFLLHTLRNGYAKFQARGVGSTFINISSEELSNFEVPALSLAEQRRIAEVLDRTEALRAKRRAALAQLDTLTQSIFLDLFGDPSTNPRAWTRRALGEVTEFFAGSTLPVGVKFTGQHDGYFLLKVSDMNLPGNETYLRVTQEWSASPGAKSCTCPPGSVVIPKRGGAIGTNKKRLSTRTSVLDPNLMAIWPKPTRLELEFLYHWFLRLDLGTITSGSSVPQLNKQDLAPLNIPVPPLDLQHGFASRIAAVEKLKASHRASLTEHDSLFAVLQHRAFRGEM